MLTEPYQNTYITYILSDSIPSCQIAHQLMQPRDRSQSHSRPSSFVTDLCHCDFFWDFSKDVTEDLTS